MEGLLGAPGRPAGGDGAMRELQRQVPAEEPSQGGDTRQYMDEDGNRVKSLGARHRDGEVAVSAPAAKSERNASGAQGAQDFDQFLVTCTPEPCMGGRIKNKRMVAAHARKAAGVQKFNLNAVDFVSEMALGLCASCCCALIIWVLVVPLFSFIAMPWIESWEGAFMTLGDFESVAQHNNFTFPREAFNAMDLDQDGIMTKEEFVNLTGSFDDPIRASAAERVFDELDLDHDGQLPAEEFYTTIGEANSTNWTIGEVEFHQRAIARWGSLDEAYRTIDTQRNQSVHMTEFRIGARMVRPVPSQADIQAIFRQMDTDRNGIVNMTEFKGAALAARPYALTLLLLLAVSSFHLDL